MMSAGLVLAAGPHVAPPLGGSQFAFFAGLFVLALISGRLLAVHISWPRRIATALIGFIVGTVVYYVESLRPAGANTGLAFGLTALLTTMTLLVLLELMARPGGAIDAGPALVRLPRPIKAFRRYAGHGRRYAQVLWIGARNGLGPALRSDPREPVTWGRRLRLTLEQSGGAFVKLGQVLSTRGDLLSPDLVGELSRLQDDVEPSPAPAIEALLEAELGARPSDVFAEFGATPVAAASIAQVHLATLRSGERVVVKVQRPGIAALVERDLEITLRLARRLEARIAWAHEIRVRELAEGLAAALREELDFQIEKGNLESVATGTATGVRVPRVFAHLSTSRVLVMEWLDGVSIRDAGPALQDLGVDRREFARGLLRCLLGQILVDGVFHADPHPGNVLALRDGGPALIDFGSVGRLNALEQSALRRILMAVERRDPSQMRDALTDLAPVHDLIAEEHLEQALSVFMARRLAPGMMPGPALFTDLFRLLIDFGLALPPQVAAVFRALVTLEGTLRMLVPDFQVIQEARPFAAEIMRGELASDTISDAVQNELLAQLPQLRRLPRRLSQLAGVAAGQGLAVRLSLFESERDRAVVSRLADRALLAFVGAILGGLSIGLLALPGSPELAPGVRLLQVLGYLALVTSAILLLRVLIAVARDRLA